MDQLRLDPELEKDSLLDYLHHNTAFMHQQEQNLELRNNELRALIEEGNNLFQLYHQNSRLANPSLENLRNTSFNLSRLRSEIAAKKEQILQIQRQFNNNDEIKSLYLAQILQSPAIRVNSIESAQLLSDIAIDYHWDGFAEISQLEEDEAQEIYNTLLAGMNETHIIMNLG